MVFTGGIMKEILLVLCILMLLFGPIEVFLLAAFITFILMLTSCDQRSTYIAPPISVIMRPASPTECSNGGTYIQVQDKDIIVCNGQSGAVGPIGATGPAGLPGTNGSDGAPGIDPTPITAVNLCPGTTTYPSTFIELGLCINHKLYGVYSEHEGFLVEIVPGAYSSRGHGSQCNFTVGADCEVTF